MKTVNKRLLRFFSSLSDETRLRIVLILADGPKSVNEIHKSMGKKNITLSAVSHQLKQLSDVDIVVYQRMGREKLFQLSDQFCWCILKDAIKHFSRKTRCKECARIIKKKKNKEGKKAK